MNLSQNPLSSKGSPFRVLTATIFITVLVLLSCVEATEQNFIDQSYSTLDVDVQESDTSIIVSNVQATNLNIRVMPSFVTSSSSSGEITLQENLLILVQDCQIGGSFMFFRYDDSRQINTLNLTFSKGTNITFFNNHITSSSSGDLYMFYVTSGRTLNVTLEAESGIFIRENRIERNFFLGYAYQENSQLHMNFLADCGVNIADNSISSATLQIGLAWNYGNFSLNFGERNLILVNRNTVKTHLIFGNIGASSHGLVLLARKGLAVFEGNSVSGNLMLARADSGTATATGVEECSSSLRLEDESKVVIQDNEFVGTESGLRIARTFSYNAHSALYLKNHSNLTVVGNRLQTAGRLFIGAATRAGTFRVMVTDFSSIHVVRNTMIGSADPLFIACLDYSLQGIRDNDKTRGAFVLKTHSSLIVQENAVGGTFSLAVSWIGAGGTTIESSSESLSGDLENAAMNFLASGRLHFYAEDHSTVHLRDNVVVRDFSIGAAFYGRSVFLTLTNHSRILLEDNKCTMQDFLVGYSTDKSPSSDTPTYPSLVHFSLLEHSTLEIIRTVVHHIQGQFLVVYTRSDAELLFVVREGSRVEIRDSSVKVIAFGNCATCHRGDLLLDNNSTAELRNNDAGGNVGLSTLQGEFTFSVSRHSSLRIEDNIIPSGYGMNVGFATRLNAANQRPISHFTVTSNSEVSIKRNYHRGGGNLVVASGQNSGNSQFTLEENSLMNVSDNTCGYLDVGQAKFLASISNSTLLNNATLVVSENTVSRNLVVFSSADSTDLQYAFVRVTNSSAVKISGNVVTRNLVSLLAYSSDARLRASFESGSRLEVEKNIVQSSLLVVETTNGAESTVIFKGGSSVVIRDNQVQASLYFALNFQFGSKLNLFILGSYDDIVGTHGSPTSVRIENNTVRLVLGIFTVQGVGHLEASIGGFYPELKIDDWITGTTATTTPEENEVQDVAVQPSHTTSPLSTVIMSVAENIVEDDELLFMDAGGGRGTVIDLTIKISAVEIAGNIIKRENLIAINPHDSFSTVRVRIMNQSRLEFSRNSVGLEQSQSSSNTGLLTVAQAQSSLTRLSLLVDDKSSLIVKENTVETTLYIGVSFTTDPRSAEILFNQSSLLFIARNTVRSGGLNVGMARGLNNDLLFSFDLASVLQIQDCHVRNSILIFRSPDSLATTVFVYFNSSSRAYILNNFLVTGRLGWAVDQPGQIVPQYLRRDTETGNGGVYDEDNNIFVFKNNSARMATLFFDPYADANSPRNTYDRPPWPSNAGYSVRVEENNFSFPYYQSSSEFRFRVGSTPPADVTQESILLRFNYLPSLTNAVVSLDWSATSSSSSAADRLLKCNSIGKTGGDPADPSTYYIPYSPPISTLDSTRFSLRDSQDDPKDCVVSQSLSISPPPAGDLTRTPTKEIPGTPTPSLLRLSTPTQSLKEQSSSGGQKEEESDEAQSKSSQAKSLFVSSESSATSRRSSVVVAEASEINEEERRSMSSESTGFDDGNHQNNSTAEDLQAAGEEEEEEPSSALARILGQEEIAIATVAASAGGSVASSLVGSASGPAQASRMRLIANSIECALDSSDGEPELLQYIAAPRLSIFSGSDHNNKLDDDLTDGTGLHASGLLFTSVAMLLVPIIVLVCIYLHLKTITTAVSCRSKEMIKKKGRTKTVVKIGMRIASVLLAFFAGSLAEGAVFVFRWTSPSQTTNSSSFFAQITVGILALLILSALITSIVYWLSPAKYDACVSAVIEPDRISKTEKVVWTSVVLDVDESDGGKEVTQEEEGGKDDDKETKSLVDERASGSGGGGGGATKWAHRHYAILFEPFYDGIRLPTEPLRRYYFVEEVLVSVFLGVIAGWTPPPDSSCTGVALAMLIVTFIHFLYVAGLRPYLRKLDLGASIGVALTQLLESGVAVWVVTTTATTANDTAMSVLSGLVYAQTFLFIAIPVIQGFWSYTTIQRRKERIRQLHVAENDEQQNEDREGEEMRIQQKVETAVPSSGVLEIPLLDHNRKEEAEGDSQAISNPLLGN